MASLASDHGNSEIDALATFAPDALGEAQGGEFADARADGEQRDLGALGDGAGGGRSVDQQPLVDVFARAGEMLADFMRSWGKE